ncbi:hypothetical protein [Burkholderia sp. FERM BP-3421]|jgi:hypothetical protein|nr:hypothetical protein [Burkholderia sp. FERM BP-3421]
MSMVFYLVSLKTMSAGIGVAGTRFMMGSGADEMGVAYCQNLSG